MTTDEKYMYRCLQLAAKGRGETKPNPMVGAVIVHDGRIIGEGYHRRYGSAHAEVNAIGSVSDVSLLPHSTMYVSLEPCAHHGKTPPCADLIVRHRIGRVVVACTDPNPSVSGRGIDKLLNAGTDVVVGVLGDAAKRLNAPFFINQLCSRPHITLKWAQSADGFIDRHRDALSPHLPVQISNSITQSLVHKSRVEIQSIMVGTNTVILDNPMLTARKWAGDNPVRIILDREGRIPVHYSVFNNDAETIVFTQLDDYCAPGDKVKVEKIDFSGNVPQQIIDRLYAEKIYSVFVEGGAQLLSSFIDSGLWDEAYIEISSTKLGDGVKAPEIASRSVAERRYLGSIQRHLKNETSRKFL